MDKLKTATALLARPNGFVPLDRVFRDLTEEERADPNILAQLHRYGASGSLSWDELLLSERVVILAEAGSGKTRELETQRTRLSEEGKAAFFVAIEALQTENLEDYLAMQAGEAERFEVWKSGSDDPAWFFLDAVDELKLTSGKLDTALGKVARSLGAAAIRARIVLTCRPTDWSPEKDFASLVSRLPLSADEQEEFATDDDAFLKGFRERTKKDVDTKAPPKLRLVVLEPLNDAQIKRFAEAKGVEDGDALLKEIRRRDAWSFARRPLDLNGLVLSWRDHKKLGTRLEQHQVDVKASLREDDPERADSGLLTPDKALEGAERLALALALTRTRTIKVPERGLATDIDSTMLDSEQVLSDWSHEERRALLRRPIFDVATYGRVRFHHRSVAEYLAAQRLSKMRDAGLSKRQLMRLLSGQLYGAKVVIPSMRAIAAWLALTNDDVQKLLLEREPEVLVTEGDAESLSPRGRAAVVEHYFRAYSSGGWRGHDLSSNDIQRLAHADLADLIKALWTLPHTNEEVSDFLLKLIWLGSIVECADVAFEAVMNSALEPHSRVYALWALKECGRTDLLRKVADDMFAQPTRWSPRIMHSSPDALFPEVISTAELIHMLETVDEGTQEVGGFSWALSNLVPQLEPGSEAAVSLRAALSALIWSGKIVAENSWYQPESKFAHHSPALSKLCLGELKRGITPTAALLHDTATAYRFHGDRVVAREENQALTSFFAEGMPWRSSAFLADSEVMTELAPTDDASYHVHHVQNRGLTGHLSGSDWSWLFDEFQKEDKPKKRAQLFECLVRILSWPVAEDPKFALLRAAVQDDKNFSLVIENMLKPYVPNPAIERMEAEHEQHQEKRRKSDRERDKSWVEWREKIQSDPVAAFDDASTDHTRWNIFRWLQNRATNNSSKNGLNDVGDVRLMFGAAIADGFEKSMSNYWRAEPPEVSSEKAPDKRNRVSGKPMLALTGLAMESAKCPDWAKKLSPYEAEAAAAWATTEMNGFPEWIEQLVLAHPAPVANSLQKEIAEELRLIATIGHPSTLSALEYGAPCLKAALAPFLKERLLAWPDEVEATRDPDPPPADPERVLHILSQVAADPEIAEFCAARFLASPCGPVAESWLRGVFANDFAAGMDVMRRGLDAIDESTRRERGIRYLAAMFGERGHTRALIEIKGDAEQLTELAKLAYECVRLEDDVQHEGVYTPGLRDEAESARNRILSALINMSGPEAYTALEALAGEPLFAHMPDRLRMWARRRAADDSEPEALTATQFRAWEQRYEHPPRNAAELFDVIGDRLDDMDFDLLHHAFSVRAQLRELKHELEVQPHIARYFYDHARGQYTVTRETEVVDSKKTDVALAATGFGGQATVELKLGDNWSVTQLESAIRDQLVGQYLRHPDCQVGYLLVTYAGDKGFKNPNTGMRMQFDEVITRLKDLASLVEAEMEGKVRLGVVGLDLRPPLTKEISATA